MLQHLIILATLSFPQDIAVTQQDQLVLEESRAPMAVIVADNTRRVPKDGKKEGNKDSGNKDKGQQEPPKLPPSEIPNKGSGNNNNNNAKPDPKLPKVDDKHCDGSPNCSTVFDGGRPSK